MVKVIIVLPVQRNFHEVITGSGRGALSPAPSGFQAQTPSSEAGGSWVTMGGACRWVCSGCRSEHAAVVQLCDFGSCRWNKGCRGGFWDHLPWGGWPDAAYGGRQRTPPHG